MSRVSIAVATRDYDRARPPVDGRVRVEDGDVNYLTMPVEERMHVRQYFLSWGEA